MKQWNDIKGEIYQEQEPLSEADLALMERKLARGGAGWFRLGLLLLLLALGGWWWFSPLQENTNQQEITVPVKNNVAMPASAERKPAQSIQPQAIEAEVSAQAGAQATGNREEVISPTVASGSSSEQENTETTFSITTPLNTAPKRLAKFRLFTYDSLALTIHSVGLLGEKGKAPLSGPKNKRFSAKVFAGYSLALNQPELNLDPDAQHYRFEELAKGTQLSGGVHLGAELHYRLYKNFSLGLGFDFFELQRQYNFNHRVDDIPVIDSASGNIIGYLTRAEAEQISASGQSSFGYLGIPFSINYTQNLSTRWSLRTEARYTHYLNIYARGRELDPQSLTLRTLSSESAQNYGSVKLSAGLQYRFSPKSILALESNYTRFSGALYQNAVYSWQPEMLGLQLGMIYEF